MVVKKIALSVARVVGAAAAEPEAAVRQDGSACAAGGPFRLVLRLSQPAVLASVVLKNCRSAMVRLMAGDEATDVQADRGFTVLSPLRQLVASPRALDTPAAGRVLSLRKADFSRLARGRRWSVLAVDCFPFFDGPPAAGLTWVQVYGDPDAAEEPPAGPAPPAGLPRRAASAPSPAKPAAFVPRVPPPPAGEEPPKRRRLDLAAREADDTEPDASPAASPEPEASPSPPEPAAGGAGPVRIMRKPGPDFGRRYRVLADGAREWLDDRDPAGDGAKAEAAKAEAAKAEAAKAEAKAKAEAEAAAKAKAKADAAAAAAKASAAFRLEEKVGDLFSSPDALAHCCSVDMAMGKGIAKIFRDRFGGIPELRSQKAQVGGVAFIKPQGQHIFVLVTKEHYYDKPTYDSLRRSLEALRAACDAEGVRRLAMPQIGCGLDGLKWDRVSGLIEDAFRGGGTRVTVYRLPPRRR